MEDAGERAATRLEQTGGKLAEGLIDKEKQLKTGAATIKGSLKVRLEPEIHRVDPEFGSTLTVSNRDSQSNFWVNLRILGSTL